MKIIRNNILPPKNYDAINIMGLLFCHKSTRITPAIILHERIHTRQMTELLFIGFYLWYFVEWLIRIPMKGNAYHNICFEREAYDEMHNKDYLKHRKPYAWMKYYKLPHA